MAKTIRGIAFIAALRSDIGIAARSLLRRPLAAAITILLVGGSTAGVTAMSSVVAGTLHRRLPVRDQDNVVLAWRRDAQSGASRLPLTPRMLADFSATTRTLGSVGGMSAVGALDLPIKLDDDVIFTKGLLVTPDFFKTLGTAAMLGRVIEPADDQIGGPPVGVISHALWQRVFGGRKDILGRSFRVNARLHAIVGVMPQAFDVPGGAELWLPSIEATPAAAARDTSATLALVGRLRPGANAAAVARDLDSFLQRQAATDRTLDHSRAEVASLNDAMFGSVRDGIIFLVVTTTILLLIACLNVGGLMLLQSTARVGEFAVRNAIGASRGDLARLMLTEGLMVGTASGVVGALLATWSVRGIVAIAPGDLTRLADIHTGWSTFGIALGLGVVAVLCAAAVPLIWVTRTDLAPALAVGGGGRQHSPTVARMRRGLVISQIALTNALLVGATLLAVAFARVLRVDLGFAPSNLHSAMMLVSAAKYSTPEPYFAMLDEVLPRIRSIPGVRDVTANTLPPLARNSAWRSAVDVPDRATTPGSDAPVTVNAVASDFFRTMAVDITAGRAFTIADRDSTPPVAIISEQLARNWWPSGNPVGKRIRLRGNGPREDAERVVVGVARESRYQDPSLSTPTVYLPSRQTSQIPIFLLVRTERDILGLRQALLDAIRGVERESWLPVVMDLSDQIDDVRAQPRLHAGLIAGVAVAAFALALVGLYGLMASLVREQRRSLAIRMALGGTPRGTAWSIVRGGLWLSGVGSVVGLGLAVLAAKLLSGGLHQIGGNDASVVVGVTAVLLIAGGVACAGPAFSAARIDIVDGTRSP